MSKLILKRGITSSISSYANTEGEILFNKTTSNLMIGSGTSGKYYTYVPLPQTSDTTKYLRADGTWYKITASDIGAAASSHTHNYSDLTNTPTIPSVGNGTITIKQAGTSKGSFTMNQSGNTTIELTDINTWRPVQDNLTSTSATDSLSANQGKVLKELADSKIPLIIGTQTSSTGSWTGITDKITSLYEGLTILYWLPYAGSGDATLNLTLKDGSTTGAINCYYTGATRLTTHIPANNVMMLTYQTITISGSSYTGWWLLKTYDSSNYTTLRNENGRIYAGANGIWRYTLVALDNNNQYQSFVTSSSTGSSKTINTAAKFRLPAIIYYYGTGNDASSGKLVSSTYAVYERFPNLDLRYSTNCTTTSFTANSPIYLECTIDEDGYFSPTTNCITQTLTSGRYYIYLGQTYSTAYQLTLTTSHPCYYYDGTNLTDCNESLYAKKSHTHKTLTLNGTSYNGGSDVDVNLLPFVIGTQTAVTGSWTGDAPSISELFDGLTIRYWLPYNGSGNATLNLTLKNGTTTGAINCYYGGTIRLTTQYSAGNIITLTYRKDATISGSSTKYTGWWADANYDTNNYDRIKNPGSVKCGTTAIVASNIIVGNNGVYGHLKSGNAFDISYPILYCSGNVSASGTSTATYYCMSFTITTTQSMTLTSYKPVYIKGKLSGTIFTPISTTPLTQNVPTSDDGYEYILLGMATTNSGTSCYLTPEHPIYAFRGGVFTRISGMENSIFKGGTTSTAGTSGLVPAPPSGEGKDMYLKGDGTWYMPSWVSDVTLSDNSLLVAHYNGTATNTTLNYLPLTGGTVTGNINAGDKDATAAKGFYIMDAAGVGRTGVTYNPSTGQYLVAAGGCTDADGNAINTTVQIGTGVTSSVTVRGKLKADNFITGTKTVTLKSATTVVSNVSLSSTDLGFTPTAKTSILVSVRKSGSPSALYLNVYAIYYSTNKAIYLQLTNGASSSATVPAGTYYIDYIVTNNA